MPREYLHLESSNLITAVPKYSILADTQEKYFEITYMDMIEVL